MRCKPTRSEPGPLSDTSLTGISSSRVVVKFAATEIGWECTTAPAGPGTVNVRPERGAGS
ncbi:MAG TPA: hypothetical protein VF815_45495 [Myxococcaceae bacterium]